MKKLEHITRASLGPSKPGIHEHGHHRVITLRVFVIILQKETHVSDYLARRTFSSFETAQQVFIRLIPTWPWPYQTVIVDQQQPHVENKCVLIHLIKYSKSILFNIIYERALILLQENRTLYISKEIKPAFYQFILFSAQIRLRVFWRLFSFLF